jgi:hypothetical protein
VRIEGRQIVIMRPVFFALGRDRTLPRSRPVLQAVADALRASPEIRRVSIAGHTDDLGDPAAKQELSRRRAHNVVDKLGFRVHTDARNGNYRWLTVQHPDQPSFQLGLFALESPMLDAATAQTLREIVAKGAMPLLVLVVDDCRAAYDRMRARGVEFTQEPVERYGSVDVGFRDPSGGFDHDDAKRPARDAEAPRRDRDEAHAVAPPVQVERHAPPALRQHLARRGQPRTTHARTSDLAGAARGRRIMQARVEVEAVVRSPLGGRCASTLWPP